MSEETKLREEKLRNGTVVYWLGKKKHNPNGPAYIQPDGLKKYYLNGVLHNANGPAVIYPNGAKEYWLHGRRHRIDGPSIVTNQGSTQYHQNGLLHNLFGPAIQGWGMKPQYWIDDKRLTKNQFENYNLTMLAG